MVLSAAAGYDYKITRGTIYWLKIWFANWLIVLLGAIYERRLNNLIWYIHIQSYQLSRFVFMIYNLRWFTSSLILPWFCCTKHHKVRLCAYYYYDVSVNLYCSEILFAYLSPLTRILIIHISYDISDHGSVKGLLQVSKCFGTVAGGNIIYPPSIIQLIIVPTSRVCRTRSLSNIGLFGTVLCRW